MKVIYGPPPPMKKPRNHYNRVVIYNHLLKMEEGEWRGFRWVDSGQAIMTQRAVSEWARHKGWKIKTQRDFRTLWIQVLEKTRVPHPRASKKLPRPTAAQLYGDEPVLGGG